MLFPKERMMYCKKCKNHQKFKSYQYKPAATSKQSKGRRRYDMKNATLHNPRKRHGQTRPIFRKKAKNTKIISIRNRCTSCNTTNQVQIGRHKVFESCRKSQTRRVARQNRIYG